MPTIYEVQAPDGRILEIEGPDDASQDQIMLAAQEIYSGLPERSVEAEALQQPEEKPFGVAEYAQAPLELGKAVTRGLGGALLSSAAGLAELADIATDRLGFEDLIDSGEDNELIRLANAGQEALQETLGASEPYRDLWFTKFGEGVGSVGAFFLPTGLIGAAGRAAGLAAKTTTGLQTAGAITAGGGMMVDDSVNRVADARLRGIEVTKDQEDAAAALSFLVGGLEAFTPLQVLKKIRGLKDPELAKQQFDAIRSVIKTGTGEGIQEVTSGLLMDAIQYGIYDENVPFGESMWDDFTIGAASGALVDAITTGMFNRRSRLSREVELDREKLIREEEERQREDYYNKVALAEESLKERDIQNQLDAIAAQEDAELAAADVLNFQVNQSEQEAFLGLTERYQPSQEALRQPKGDIEGRDIESTVTKQGREYARQIARNASKKAGLFPSTGRFEIREEQGGPSGTNYVVYNTADGRQYGQPTKDLEFAKHFSLGLNNEMINKSVNESIIDAMDMSPESYDPKTAESIFMIGQRLNRPKSYTISEATLNEAAGTVASKDKPFLENLTLDQIHQIQYGVPPFQDGKKKLYKDLKNLTASQQINFERAKKGLPPLKEFTLQEAKDALGDKYDKVFDVLLDVQQPDLAAIRQEFGEAGVNVQGGRQRYQDEINTLKEVKDTLASKNIVSDIGSKELSYVFKKITGESSVSKMTPSQRMFLVGELKKLPALDKPSKLPDLSPKPYTRADFNNAMNYVISTGDGTVDNIKAVLPEDLSEKRKSVAAGQIRAELLSRGVINKDNTVSELTALPAPEPRKPTEVTEKDFTTEQSVEALDFQKKLSEALKGFGLDDIRVSILDQMKTKPEVTRDGRLVDIGSTRDFSAAEGLFDPRSRTIFLGLDSARTNARDQSPEAFDFALSEVMDHEMVHAMRNLDLWTQKEWSLLENSARKFKVPGTNKTFYQDAIERYVTQQPAGSKLSPVQAMEEAVAELVRYSKKDRKLVGGKPRNLIDRVFEFFRRLGSAMQGTGFNSMNDLINDIESGALGARERGVVRTARGMETARRAVPERGIGLARDVKTEFTTRTEVTGRDGSSATTTVTRDIPVAGEDEQPVEGGVQMSINRIIGRNGTELNQAPDGKTAHGLPSELLVDGPKQEAKSIVVQNFTPQNTDQVLSNIQTVKSNNPDALGSTENWIAMEDDAFGGDFVPIPPLKAIQYAQSPELLAEKLKQLTPDLKAGVDEGFKYVQQIKNLYNTQPTSPDLTGRLFMWGLLSRGAGPVQQEFAFLNLLESAAPYIKKASEGKMTQADVIKWKRLVGKSIPSSSPAKSATMNANDIGKLLFELGKVPDGSSQTVMQTLHNMLADPNVSGREFRNEFFRLTNKPGVDNKVVSFIALVAGKDDVLVMDRIQGRHLWNDGRFGDKNIYNGLKKGKVKSGLNAIFAGPRGLLITESLEDGLSTVVQQAYDIIGRPQDASVGRMHWETWVIDGNQAVSHSTLEAVRTGSGIGGSVTEGKRGTFSSGTTYRQTANGPITEYPLSDGTVARMTLDQQKEFEAFIKTPKNGIVPKGFLVGRSKDRPWFELPEVNREKLDEAARRFENANPDGSIRSGNARSIQAGASDAGRRRAAAGPVGSVEAPATDEISLSLKRLDGMPESFDVNGQAVEFGYFEPAVTAAKRYTERSGKVYEPLTEYAPINEDVARKIAAEFEIMEHRPDDPEVMAAYDAMIEETKDQYRDILNSGLKVQFIKGEDPYGNPRNVILDVVNNNHMWVFSTVDGFGSDADLDVSDNPLLQATEFETADGDPMLANDVFRVVHDYFGHIKNGVGFRARGEENAWQAHAAMYSPLARRAMTTETRGQNSYVNFGPNRDFNLTANGADTVYADQKVGLLPLWVSEEARLSDPRRRDGRIFQEGLQGAIRDDGKVSLTHYSRGKINRTDPSLAGGGLDRSRRYSPKGTYFGITEAVDDGYRKETGLGPVENKFSVDPVLLYPLAKDYLGLVERYPAGNMDYDATIQNLKDNGFIGFWNNSTYGKAAFIFEPLIADKAASKIMGVDSDQILESLKRVDGIIERNPAESITRIYDESATRPFLEEQEINGYPPFSWQAKTYSVGDRIVYQMADKLIGLKKAEEGINRYRALAGIPPIKNKDSAYVGEESIPGKIGIEVKDFQENVQRPYAKKIADSGIPIEELDEFLTFRHAVERNNRIQLRDPSRNVETNPGSGSLKTGERLSNFYVKQIMENRYGYEWDDASGSWVGGNDRGKKLMGLAADADSIVNSTIDRMIKGGLLSKDNAEALRGLYKYYAPLKGKAQEDDFADFVAVGSGLSTKGKEYKMALGRESASESPLGHIMLNAERTIARSVKNESFGQKLVKLIKDNPNSDFWNVYSSSDPRFKQAVDTHYTYIGKESGMQGQRYPDIPKGMDRKDFVKYVVIKQDGLAKFDGDLIGAKDGEEFFVELKDERLRRAILSVNASEADNLIRKFSMVNRFLSMMNTSLNPEFVVGNFSRDLQTAIYNIVGEQTMQGGKIKDVKRITRRVLKDVIPSMGIVYKGMRRYNMKDGTLRSNITGISEADYLDFREFMESGAKADWFYNRPAEEQAQTIQNMVDMANGTFTGNFRKGYEGVMNFVEDANSSVENAVRFAAFKAARDELLNSGVDRAEAVATASTLAKNLTVNFNRKGMQGDLLNALYLFYNASVQGTMNFARGLNVFDPGSSRTKQAMVASMIGFGALMAARGEEESEENPDSGRSYYSEIPDYIKERNIVIMAEPSEAPKKGASNIYLDKNGKEYANKAQYYYTIPLPYGYNVFHVAGVKLFEMKNDTISVEKASGDLLSAFLGSFSPIGFFPLPTITQPFWELAKNENYFGSPIYKENFPTGVQSPASQLAMSSTRTPFKNAAKILNSLTGGNEYESGYMDVSPDALEHIAEFALGGAGTFGLRSMNAFEKWMAGEELESREVPFLRRVMGEPDKNIAVADYYDRKVKLEQKEAAIQGLRGADRIKYREQNQDYVTMFGVLNSIERKLRKVRQMESQLRSRAALSPANAEQYATGLEVLEERKQKLYDQFNNLYDKRVGRTK
jgi:hypothetical protein